MHYHFAGELTARDCKRHIPHPISIPANTGRIAVSLRFTPERVHNTRNMLTLTLFDPNGFRGAGHRGGAFHEVTIDANAATPGYLPGFLPAGEWVVQIDTHMIMPGQPLHYWLDVTLTAASGAEQNATSLQSPRKKAMHAPQRGPDWYRGDLHSHTNHSDAGDRTVAELVQMARDHRLDFLFLTDHNTTSSLDEVIGLANADLLTCGGIELTTFWGHALCLGARTWVDWRIRPGSGEITRIAENAYASEQVFVIAHPDSMGDPACTGCAWRYGEMMPGAAQVVEIWNGRWRGDSDNEATLALWYDWLNQGRRLAASAGTDTHGRQDYAARPGFNVIYAQSLTESALLHALRAGRLYLSAGPRLGFHAYNENGRRWMIGDCVTEPVTLGMVWEDVPPSAHVRLLANGRLLQQWPCDGDGGAECELTPIQADWVVMELRAGDGDLLAVTNPIYFGDR